MKNIGIDFGMQGKRWSHYMTPLLVLAALTCTVFEARAYFTYYSENKAFQVASDANQVNDDASKNLTPLDEELQTKLKHVTQLIEQVDTPWDTLFSSVESVSERRELQLTAEAKDLNAMLRYVQLISASNGLTDVYLSSQQVNVQDVLHPIRFTLVANWKTLSAKTQTAIPLRTTDEPAT